jgi:hypothetical protein
MANLKAGYNRADRETPHHIATIGGPRLRRNLNLCACRSRNLFLVARPTGQASEAAHFKGRWAAQSYVARQFSH